MSWLTPVHPPVSQKQTPEEQVVLGVREDSQDEWPLNKIDGTSWRKTAVLGKPGRVKGSALLSRKRKAWILRGIINPVYRGNIRRSVPHMSIVSRIPDNSPKWIPQGSKIGVLPILGLDSYDRKRPTNLQGTSYPSQFVSFSWSCSLDLLFNLCLRLFHSAVLIC